MPAAIVTGAESGIGRASAVALARDGFDVGITWYLDEGRAREAVREIEGHGVRAELRRLDLSELPGAAAETIDGLADALGGVDALVNNAGTGDRGYVAEQPFEEWRRVLSVNLDGPFLCSQAAARRMIRQGRGGRIVNITSVHEHVPARRAAAYCASKGGLGQLTRVMALELADHGITVNSIAPGEIATPMTGMHDKDPYSVKRPRIPLNRPGHAREIAAWVAFLASPASSYATGASFVVDGGMLLMAAEPHQY
jgi:NAD(P)-dependent dehydrogenase (short-subunit alcohol dehydrogenase family)